MTEHSREPISIVGGGLSGLALGILLRRNGVKVDLFESHPYPHHRVCGEFVTGLRHELIHALGIGDLIGDAHRHQQTSWHDEQGEAFYHLKLQRPAFGLSRYTWDERLANRFTESGGNLIEHRWREYDRHEKVVYATGRRHTSRKVKPRWLGLKLHARGFASATDLEMHLGHGGYVGASAVEDGITNLCGLFPLDSLRSERSSVNFENALEAIGLHHLREQLDSCEVVAGSRCGTMYFQPGYQPGTKTQCALGDSMMQIPPFTGHGMSMALEAAWIAHTHVLAYVNGETDWKSMTFTIRESIRKQHAARLRFACLLHPLMLQGNLPRYWKIFGAALKLLPPRVAPMLWGNSPRLKLT